ncbi:MAG: hypothetical protein EAZ98_16870, partial [Oscillatoriales cyanobacterium]
TTIAEITKAKKNRKKYFIISPSGLPENQRKNQNHTAAPNTISQNNFLQLPLDSPGYSTKVYL